MQVCRPPRRHRLCDQSGSLTGPARSRCRCTGWGCKPSSQVAAGTRSAPRQARAASGGQRRGASARLALWAHARRLHSTRDPCLLICRIIIKDQMAALAPHAGPIRSIIPRAHVSWHNTHPILPRPWKYSTLLLDQTAEIPQSTLMPGYNRETGRKIVQKL